MKLCLVMPYDSFQALKPWHLYFQIRAKISDVKMSRVLSKMDLKLADLFSKALNSCISSLGTSWCAKRYTGCAVEIPRVESLGVQLKSERRLI